MIKTTQENPHELRRREAVDFWGHVDELRDCIVKSFIAFTASCIIVYQFIDPFLKFITKPVGKLVFTSPADAFLARMNLTLLGAFLLSLPVILWQVWGFASTGLRENEKKFLRWVIPSSIFLFFLGTVFAYFVAVPFSMKFLLGFASDVFVPMITVDHYISFLGTLIFGFGITFELPLVIFFLAKIGIATPAFLEHYRRYAIVLILIISAIVTPPDLISLFIMSIPLIILYEVGIQLVRWTYRGEHA